MQLMQKPRNMLTIGRAFNLSPFPVFGCIGWFLESLCAPRAREEQFLNLSGGGGVYGSGGGAGQLANKSPLHLFHGKYHRERSKKFSIIGQYYG